MFFDKFFLASSTADGFNSFFTDRLNCKEGYKTYIIKGGPGTGKSTLMKKIVKTAEKKGEKVTLCPCSSDPESLDAVLLHDRKITVLDGTAPHTVEPQFVGIGEEIVNLAVFKPDSFNFPKQPFFELFALNSACHSAAARYLSAAGKLLADSRTKARDCADSDRAIRFALSLSDRIFKTKNSSGKITKGYLSIPTVNGRMFLKESILNASTHIAVIEDEYRAVTPLIMEVLLEKAISKGYDTTVCYCPYLPAKTIEHLFFPEINFAVITKSRLTDFGDDIPSRIIHSRRFINNAALKAKKSRLLFNRKAAFSLIDAACEQITNAKKIHDEIEKYYVSAMDFSRAEEISHNLITKIFQ